MADRANPFVRPTALLRACCRMFTPELRCSFEVADAAADGTTILKALSVATGSELGRMTYSTLPLTSTTYVWDIDVLPRWRRRGVGKALLRHAGILSPYQDFALVTVVPESILFWRSVVLDKSLQQTMSVRMGLSFPEVDHLTRYQASFERAPYLGVPSAATDHAG